MTKSNWIPEYKKNCSFEEFIEVLYARAQFFIWQPWPEKRPARKKIVAAMRRGMYREMKEQRIIPKSFLLCGIEKEIERGLLELIDELIAKVFIWFASKDKFKNFCLDLRKLLEELGLSVGSESSLCTRIEDLFGKDPPPDSVGSDFCFC